MAELRTSGSSGEHRLGGEPRHRSERARRRGGRRHHGLRRGPRARRDRAGPGTRSSATPCGATSCPKQQFEELMAASGIDNDTTVVLYGDNNNWFAAWAFWQMKIYGHKDVRHHERRPQEVAGRGPRADHRRSRTCRRATYKATDAGSSRCARSCRRCRQAVAGEDRGAGGRAQPAGVHRRDPGASRTARNLPARRPHSRRAQHPVGQGLQRRRHVQDRPTN